jgi:hypothetical protein
LVVGPDGTIYIADQSGNVIAVAPDGTRKWAYNVYGISALGLVQPVVGPDGTIYVTETSGLVYAFSPSGTIKWKYTMANSRRGLIWNWQGAVVDAGGTIYVSNNDGFIYAINPDGTLKWTWKDPHNASITSNLVITQPHSPTGLLVFGDSAGYLYAIGVPPAIGAPPPKTPNIPKISVALAPNYSLWALLLVAMCVAGFAFASRGKMVLGISFIAVAIAVYYVVLRPFVSLQTLIAQAQQLISNALAQIPLGPILPLIIAVAGIAVLAKGLRR